MSALRVVGATRDLSRRVRGERPELAHPACCQHDGRSQDLAHGPVFLPNPDAHTPQVGGLYAGFGLNAQQIQIIAKATPKREYYYQSSTGNRLFELGLGPVSLAVVGSSSPGDQQLMTKLLEEHGPAELPANECSQGRKRHGAEDRNR